MILTFYAHLNLNKLLYKLIYLYTNYRIHMGNNFDVCTHSNFILYNIPYITIHYITKKFHSVVTPTKIPVISMN